MGLFKRSVTVARDVALDPVFRGPERDRTEMFSTVFHGLVNLLVELFALTAAFIFFLSAESTKAVQNQIVSTIDRPQVVGAAARAVQGLLVRACEAGREVPEGEALDNCCSPGGRVESITRALLASARALTPPAELGGDASDVQNVWVMRLAVLFCALGLLALVVAYLVTRLARGPRIPLLRIVLYNVLLFVFAFAVQVAFMGLVTLRYVPIMPSDQLRALRVAVEREERNASVSTQALAAEAATLSFAAEGQGGSGGSGSTGAGVAPESIVPASAGTSILVVLALIAAVAAVLFLAWRSRAFRMVSTAQGLCIQLAFIFAIMVGVYFWLSNSIGAELQASAIGETVGYIAQIARQLPTEQGPREVWAAVRASLDQRAVGIEESDRIVGRRNAEILREVRVFALVMGSAFAAVILLTALARRQALRWRFWVGLLLVGLVGGTTTLLVEYGFAQNVLRNYKPISAPQLTRQLVAGMSSGIERHAQWFCQDARCGDAARAVHNSCCDADAPGPMDFRGERRNDVRWARIPRQSAAAVDMALSCIDESVWNLDHLYADSARWFEDAKNLFADQDVRF
jgi:hypothetical protein